jgi:Pectic acid lyase
VVGGVARADLDHELDALVASQRGAGGWTFASPPGGRAEPFTLVVRTAERVLAPIGLATWDLVVVRSPGTPAAGLVLLEGWRRTGREEWLAAARRAGDFLVATELEPGGWFSELPVHDATTPWWFRLGADTRPMLDDDVTPGAIRLLLELWAATGDVRYRGAAERAIDLVMTAQLPSGAWPLDARPSWLRRLHPHYEDQPALNDGATPFAITTLIEASRLLGRPELLTYARRGGDWLLAVQKPTHGGWAQQYTMAGEPASARAFEQPALASWETRHAVEALLALAEATGDGRYCGGAIAGARWLHDVRVAPECWARFYDVATGKPIFVDAGGRPVPSSVEARPGYSWMGDYGIPWLLARMGITNGPAPYRIPGDPGRCTVDPSPPRPLAGMRATTAEAARLLAGEDAPASAVCRLPMPPTAAP